MSLRQLFAKTDDIVLADEVKSLLCPLCKRPAGLFPAGDTNVSRAHESCGLLLHVSLAEGIPGKSSRADFWKVIVTDVYGNRVVEKPNLARGTVDLVLEPPNAPTDPSPGPDLRVAQDGSIGMDVVWVK